MRGPEVIEADRDANVLSQVSNERIPSYTWTGAPPPDKKNLCR